MKIILAFFAMFLGCFFCWARLHYPVPADVAWWETANLIKAFHLLLGVSLFANAFNFVRKVKDNQSLAHKPTGLLLSLFAALMTLGVKTIYIITITPKFADVFTEQELSPPAAAATIMNLGVVVPIIITTVIILTGSWACWRNNNNARRYDGLFIVTTMLLFVILLAYSVILNNAMMFILNEKA